MSDQRGHLFVVHGRIESVVHDFALIPTSDSFNVRGYWKPITGERPERLKPAGWPGGGVGKASGRKNLWFISVGGARSVGVSVLIDRATAAVAEIMATNPVPSRNRTKPLIAVPVLGIRGGGLGGERGEVIGQLIEAMEKVARDYDVDIAIVTPDLAVYSAAQHLRVSRGNEAWSLSDKEFVQAQRLAGLAKSGDLALFLGAGVSIPAGLPTWDQLIETLARKAAVRLDDAFLRLPVLDQAQFIQRKLPELGDHVAEIVTKQKRPSLAHVLLAALDCREAVTTNYDRLYEKAISIQRGKGNVASILPWQSPSASRPWVLKMHGDYKQPNRIVLSREQFVAFDAKTRPAGALLQTLLLTRHVLFVGASLNDDNVVRLAYEVNSYRTEHEQRGKVGTLLDVTSDDVRRRLWSGQLHWLSMTGNDLPESARSLEVFLDAVAAHASRDSSWLLDARFQGLLHDDTGLAADAGDLYERAAAAGGKWKALADRLAELGAAE
ncbi:hypothetical protein ABIE44_002752 [Marmoricola sp. OAE513]|uniref:SIR2 family protein n=1 Tax=Marmoricola sp. OAE513 TaxID=2817894 RepID=UPI001AEA873C